MTKTDLNLKIQDIERDTKLTPAERSAQIDALHIEYSKSINLANRHMKLRYPGVTAKQEAA